MPATIVRPYLAIFAARFSMLLQYRAAALAGIATQFWFGAIMVMALSAFYGSGRGAPPITLAQAITYIWLGQAFLGLLPWNVDTEIAAMMRSGNVAYERLRPVDTYFYWFARALAWRAAGTLLRSHSFARRHLCPVSVDWAWRLVIAATSQPRGSRAVRAFDARRSPLVVSHYDAAQHFRHLDGLGPGHQCNQQFARRHPVGHGHPAAALSGLGSGVSLRPALGRSRRYSLSHLFRQFVRRCGARRHRPADLLDAAPHRPRPPAHGAARCAVFRSREVEVGALRLYGRYAAASIKAQMQYPASFCS